MIDNDLTKFDCKGHQINRNRKAIGDYHVMWLHLYKNEPRKKSLQTLKVFFNQFHKMMVYCLKVNASEKDHSLQLFLNSQNSSYFKINKHCFDFLSCIVQYVGWNLWLHFYKLVL